MLKLKPSIGESVCKRLQRRNFFTSSDNSSVQSYVVRRRLNHPQEIVYKAVEDVASYKHFIPYCIDSFVNKRDALSQPTEAGLRVGWKQFDETFVCKLTCTNKTQVIAESNTASLFKDLYSEWNITKSDRKDACNVELKLRYQFHNGLYNTVSSIFNQKVTEIMIKAFERRATELRRQNQKQN